MDEKSNGAAGAAGGPAAPTDWWAEDEKWLGENEGALMALDAPNASVVAPKAALAGAGSVVLLIAVELLGEYNERGAFDLERPVEFMPEQGCRQAIARTVLGEVEAAPVGPKAVGGLVKSARMTFATRGKLLELRAHVDTVCDLMRTHTEETAGYAPETAEEIERRRQAGMAIVRSALSVNLELSRDIVGGLRTLLSGEFLEKHPRPK